MQKGKNIGDTHSANVVLDGYGGYRLKEVLQGDGIDALLRYVRFESEQLAERFRYKLFERVLILRGLADLVI